MIDFGRSYFTWTSRPVQPDPYHKYAGGFVGKDGAVHRVRIQFDAACTLTNDKTGRSDELFLLCPCRTEYTIVTENLFQVPNGEFRVVFGREHSVPLAKRPTTEKEPLARRKLSEQFASHKIDLRAFESPRTVTTPEGVIEATTADAVMNGRTTYRDAERGVTVTLEYPIKLINLQQPEKLFQVCMGPVPLPDLATWDGVSVDRAFLAHLAFTGFDYIEFALRRAVQPADAERGWFEAVRGRDRNELRDPGKRPPGPPRGRPALSAYNEVVAMKASNQILVAPAEAGSAQRRAS